MGEGNGGDRRGGCPMGARDEGEAGKGGGGTERLGEGRGGGGLVAPGNGGN